jgi:hypothetical protein
VKEWRMPVPDCQSLIQWICSPLIRISKITTQLVHNLHKVMHTGERHQISSLSPSLISHTHNLCANIV